MNDISIHHEQSPSAAQSQTILANRPANRAHKPQNVSQTERLISTVGGSALVLAGLSHGKVSGLLLSVLGGALVHRGVTGHCYGYEALGIDTAEHHPAATAVPAQQGVKVEKSIAVNRSPEDIYSFWRNFENLPQVMRHLEKVEVIEGNRSRWVAKGPFGKCVQWEAEVYNEREPELIAWRSVAGDIETSGSVHFKPLGHDRGTSVTISMKYNPPGGKVGASVAKLLGSGLEQELNEDLHQFKSIMEAGEAPTTQGQPSARS